VSVSSPSEHELINSLSTPFSLPSTIVRSVAAATASLPWTRPLGSRTVALSLEGSCSGCPAPPRRVTRIADACVPYRSIRPATKFAAIQLDTAYSAFTETGPLIEVAKKILNVGGGGGGAFRECSAWGWRIAAKRLIITTCVPGGGRGDFRGGRGGDRGGRECCPHQTATLVEVLTLDNGWPQVAAVAAASGVAAAVTSKSSVRCRLQRCGVPEFAVVTLSLTILPYLAAQEGPPNGQNQVHSQVSRLSALRSIRSL
jgi:hypothetical protein